MSMFIHVDSDDGSMYVRPYQIDFTEYLVPYADVGWVYEVPDDFKFDLTLGNCEEHLYIYELLLNDPRAVLVAGN